MARRSFTARQAKAIPYSERDFKYITDKDVVKVDQQHVEKFTTALDDISELEVRAVELYEKYKEIRRQRRSINTQIKIACGKSILTMYAASKPNIIAFIDLTSNVYKKIRTKIIKEIGNDSVYFPDDVIDKCHICNFALLATYYSKIGYFPIISYAEHHLGKNGRIFTCCDWCDKKMHNVTWYDRIQNRDGCWKVEFAFRNISPLIFTQFENYSYKSVSVKMVNHYGGYSIKLYYKQATEFKSDEKEQTKAIVKPDTNLVINL
jgi:hypothetical protein